MKIKLFVITLCSLVISGTYAQTCPSTYQKLAFFQATMDNWHFGVDCWYGDTPDNEHVLAIGFDSIYSDYEYTYGPWKLSSPRHFVCRSTDSANCGFEKIH